MASSILNPTKHQVILASKSPRRSQLLKQLGLHFDQVKIDTDENYPAQLPASEIAEYLSIKKAKAALKLFDNKKLIICADTVVICDETILEKPSSHEEAKRMLNFLSGKSHDVISGVCLVKGEKFNSFSVSTKVFMKALEADEIEYYVSNFQPFDKAGAYGIQEWIGLIGIEKIEGSYYNVMGLPVKELSEALRQF